MHILDFRQLNLSLQFFFSVPLFFFGSMNQCTLKTGKGMEEKTWPNSEIFL